MFQRRSSATGIILMMMIAGSLGWRVYTNDLAKKYTEYWSSFVIAQNFDPVILEYEDSDKFFTTVRIKLNNGKLYGLTNLTIAEGDDLYVEPGYPIVISGTLTFPHLRTSYEYEFSTLKYFESTGNANVYRKNVKFNMELMVEPMFTKKTNLKLTLADIGEWSADGDNKATDDDFHKYVDESHRRVFQQKVSLLAEGLEKKISDNLTEFAGMVAKDLVQGSTVGFACDKSKKSPCNFFIQNSEDSQE